MTAEAEVRQAALDRAAALAAGDRDKLLALLHPDFPWTSHTGEQFDRDAHLVSNTRGGNRWSGQQLVDAEVVVHEQTAVLRCLAVDTVDGGSGEESLGCGSSGVTLGVDWLWSFDSCLAARKSMVSGG